jgi:adenine-specific DNA methylase
MDKISLGVARMMELSQQIDKSQNSSPEKRLRLLPFDSDNKPLLSFEQNNDLKLNNVNEEIFRPIQYLGSKKRSLKFIIEATRQLQQRPETVLDLFSGTSIVSQALAHEGYKVLAADAMAFCAVFARSLLGVGRGANQVDIDKILKLLQPSSSCSSVEQALEPWLSKEREALNKTDSDALIDVSKRVPQIWRPQGASSALSSQFDLIRNLSGKSAIKTASLICTHYAGTYFGVIQAVEIDRIRVGIEELYTTGQINGWEKDLSLTTLLSVSSDCAFSPGKHFAQSHLIRDGKDLSFIRARILQDRAINVWSRFCTKISSIVACARGIKGQHRVFHATFEDLFKDSKELPSFSLIYADPPYTAQQYSRFYHLPETIITYTVPTLQEHKGEVTRGLYPENRFKSRFSSKREAPRAFHDLFTFAKQHKASLLISYSDSSTGKTGNDRMISMKDLLKICHQHFNFNQIQIIELEHEYRQFNQTKVAVSGRLDKEFLILCEQSC